MAKKNEATYNADTFNLEKQYQLYLQRMKLSEDKMPLAQRIETKRAFMGACGQLLFIFRDDVTALPDLLAIKAMESMKNQVMTFWNNETRGKN